MSEIHKNDTLSPKLDRFVACQPMRLSIKLATGIFCISVKFHYFPNQQQCCKIHDIHVGHFGINDVLMFEAGFVLQS